MSRSFAHLHVHSEYSTLDGASRLPQIVQRAAELGMPAVALTDHGNLYGLVEFYQAAKKAKIKPIFGCELYLAYGPMTEKKQRPGKRLHSHLTVLAENDQGLQNLIKLVSKAHLDGFYYKPRIDKECLAAHKEGLIALSGCLLGEINQHILQDQLDLARQSIGEFMDIFGREHFFLEVHDHGMEQQHKCTRQMRAFAKEFRLDLVAANDVHFMCRDDHEAHDVMICIGTGSQVHDENRLHYSPEVHFKTAEEMYTLFADIPEACENTVKIAERCNVSLKLDATSSEKYPQYDAPDGSPRDEYFRRLCHEGLRQRYGERVDREPELTQRLDYEIEIMIRMGFVSYFLIVWDFIRWAKDHDIPVGPGRGSAAGSLIAYSLEITDLCPLEFGLIFERFLNPERVSPPDVDVDFCQSRRGEVIEYVRQKYGERAVSHIITFGTLGAKSVIRDVGRVLGLGYNEADRIAKMIPAELGITLEKAREKNPELAAAIENEGKVQQLWKYATYLEGLTRGTGIHAAGIVIGDRPLDEFIPLTRGNEGEVVTQLAMGPLTECGMLKMDFLGLKTLTVIQDAVSLIHEHRPDFRINGIPHDDPRTYELISAGQTIGVFQLESGGMTNLCRQFGVSNLEDISALLALYRPGPMDLIPDYIARKKGEKKIAYEHPLLEQVCANTYGIMIYQEQVQKAANVLAGYSLGQADLLRRAMGKKDKEKMAVERERFVEGCAATNKIPAKKANAIFDLLEKFAGYGFNKSHSCAYGLITYQTAFLKANYPVEFMAAVLSNEIDNTDKISVFVNECKSMGIEILPPDVNGSQIKFAPERVNGQSQNGLGGAGKAIRFGLAAIKGIGEGAMELVLESRAKEGEFKSLEDFGKRLSVNRKVLETLIKAGAFDFTKESRAALFARIEQVLASSAEATKDRASGQASLFGDLDFGATQPASRVSQEPLPEWSKEEMLAQEKELLGFYVTGHPLDPYRATIESKKSIKSFAELEDLTPGKSAKHRFAGMITESTVKYSKKDNKPFAVLRAEDLTTTTEILVWNDVYSKTDSALLQVGAVIELSASIDLDSRTETRRLVASGIGKLKIEKDDLAVTKTSKVQALRLYLASGRDSESDLLAIRDVLREHQGPSPVFFVIRGQDGRENRLRASQQWRVTRGPELETALAKWMSR